MDPVLEFAPIPGVKPHPHLKIYGALEALNFYG
jgi:hypothetical protein